MKNRKIIKDTLGKSKILLAIIMILSISLTSVTAMIILPSQFIGRVSADDPVPLPGSEIPKFVTQLTGPPPVYTPTNWPNDKHPLRQDYSINMEEKLEQAVLPQIDFGYGANLMTKVWGYGGIAHDAVTGEDLGYVLNSPGPSFEVTKGIPTTVTWNNLITTAQQFAVDPTLHWANPNQIPMPTEDFPDFPPGYPEAQSPVPLVTHVHGAEVPPESDGGPDAWWTNTGIKGPGYSTAAPTNDYSAVYDYPNINQESTIWYHDHALGVTRLNVMSGLAGFYIVRDPESETGAVLPTGKYDMPLVFQDRNFLSDGSFLFPDLGVQPAVHPYWIPEFFGDTIMVNGLVWPNMDVDQGTYRFRMLDGSNARFYTVSFVVTDSSDNDLINDVLSFTQIASDDGYLADPVELTEFTFAPGERVEILLDFSELPEGTTILVQNTANENFPAGEPVDPNTAGQLMQFTVTSEPGPEMPELPETLNPTLPEYPTLGVPDKTRVLTLVEIVDPDFDVPLELVLDGQKWGAPAYEIATAGETEDWIIFNPTADSHPIHTHLVQFQLLSRQDVDIELYYADWLTANGVTEEELPLTAPTVNVDDWTSYLLGEPEGPSDGERGWKDTVMMHPGQVTIIRMRFAPVEISIGSTKSGINYYPFDPTGAPGYVWHCHILDHEDNEMMRPLLVTATAHAQPNLPGPIITPPGMPVPPKGKP